MNAVEIHKLSQAFYDTYPHSLFPEILEKESRPYTCLVIRNNNSYTICIPFRTEIRHKNAYMFQSSSRSVSHRSGLDYSKMVIIENPDYFSYDAAIVDSDEYTEVVLNIDRISRESFAYLSNYINFQLGNTTLNIKEFKRKYQFSPLKYFHKELGICI